MAPTKRVSAPSSREVRAVIEALEYLAVARGLRPPAVYGIVLFEDLEDLDVKSLVKVSEEVLVGEGVIAVKQTEVMPLLARRLLVGYYSLAFLSETGKVPVDEVTELAKEDVWKFLTVLSRHKLIAQTGKSPDAG